MYHLFFFVLLIFSLLELFTKIGRQLTFAIFLAVGLFAIFRYGQGSDYFNYLYLLNAKAVAFEKFLEFSSSDVGGELGFSFIAYLTLNKLNLSAEFVSALFSGVSFFLFAKFVLKYSTKPLFSLFVFYCIFYLIYPFSAIRQSLVISLFLVFMVESLYHRKYLQYSLVLLLLYSIHYSAIILAILPFLIQANLNKLFEIKYFVFLSLTFIAIGLGMSSIFNLLFSYSSVFSMKLIGYESETFDIASLFLRFLLVLFIFPLHKYYDKSSIKSMFYKIYLIGFFVYLLFIFSPLISSRLSVYMRYFEFILLADVVSFQIAKYKTERRLNLNLYFSIVAISSAVYVKNINSFILQGEYSNEVNFANYRYVSVFEKNEIFRLREIPAYYDKFID